MKFIYSFLLIASVLFADEALSLEDDFLQSLDDVSEIATKTKLNVDDTPSFVTVLTAKKLQKLGIDTVFEALGQVPGVQVKKKANGIGIVIFRGIFQKDTVRLMIDGVVINNTYRGSIYHFLNFPIEMVKRIEVIRGAGSVLYGSGALSGVINVITKSSSGDDLNSVFISGGTYDYYKGGAIVSSKVGEIQVSADVYYQETKKIIESTDRQMQDYSVGLKVNSEHFTFLSRVKKEKQGNAYGLLGVADTNTRNHDSKYGAYFAQLAYENSLGKHNNIKLTAGVSRYTKDVHALDPSETGGSIDILYAEQMYYGQVELHSKSIPNNDILVGLRYQSVKAEKSEWTTSTTRLTPSVDPNSKRKTISIYLNDKYTFLNDLDITAGVRYDSVSDYGDDFSPTIALVYRATSKLRIKSLYGHAFRAPSWKELTSNSNLKSETSESIELGFIYKVNSQGVLRFNIYDTSINNFITNNPTIRKYIQTENVNFLGSEFEYEYQPTSSLEVNFFASFVKATDSQGVGLAEVAELLGTLSAVYETKSGLSFGGLAKYVGSSSRSSLDTRENMPSSILVDGTLSYSFKTVEVFLILKDIFDRGTYYALPTSTNNNDFYDAGRSVLLKASWEF